MITLTFSQKSRQPLYEQLYRRIRQEIETGGLAAGDKLPSKRRMADHLKVSLRTVENAYAQLMVEGYVESFEKKYYTVRPLEKPVAGGRPKTPRPRLKDEPAPAGEAGQFDLKTNRININDFPFSVWTRLLRSSLRDERQTLLEPVHPQGDLNLRLEIVKYLSQFRSMEVEAGQVVIGAGTEYLLGLVSELLKGQSWAIEDPSYHKPAKILSSKRIKFAAVGLDAEGMSLEKLRATKASAVLITPSHHFPLGTVMSVNRRLQLLDWARQKDGRYLIEDDYDSEYRFALKPVPPLHSLDRHNRVIYMNTFTRTLAPALRIAYMVLPPDLLSRYRKKLMFYACTVSEIEQCALWKFMGQGHYERHLSRVRNICRGRRDALIRGLSPLAGLMDIEGQEAGLHLLLSSKENIPDKELLIKARQKGVEVYPLSNYFLRPPEQTATVLAGYAGYDPADLERAGGLLAEAWAGGDGRRHT